ncbi:acid phosphatase [Magnetospirillum molischianum]|uniref:Phosphoesterase PA-phosphatase related protein n=1 Tax=Magnetospirillum molischianum DSM 120 TaxID=1150626 RepID=H8FVK7_MAGML|nr:phosphatase PAP2 family protein [Magnetospirillum molischianum]CCG42395.1 Phosphoesterase PA-phosphatase related protein [Magnetospirillum molischianum DSM 120]
MRRFFAVLLLLVVIAFPAYADSSARIGYLGAEKVDLVSLLPPPPRDETFIRSEIDYLLSLQRQRTEAQVKQAQADEDKGIDRFLPAIGDLDLDRLPKTRALFERLGDDLNQIVAATKAVWLRPRPFLVEPTLDPCVTRPKGSSYPSRHNAYAMLTAEVLARMAPDRRDALFARARHYGEQRMIGGVHYPSDVEAGRMAGLIIAERLFANPAFAADLAEATAEMEAARQP